jgi:hypothetical protein
MEIKKKEGGKGIMFYYLVSWSRKAELDNVGEGDLTLCLFVWHKNSVFSNV